MSFHSPISTEIINFILWILPPMFLMANEAVLQMLFTCLFHCSLLPIDSPPRSLANTGTTYQDSWILAQHTEISLSSFVRKQICMIMHVSCCYELYEMYTFSFIPRRALLGHYTSYCILAAIARIQFLLSAVIMWRWQCLFIYW